MLSAVVVCANPNRDVAELDSGVGFLAAAKVADRVLIDSPDPARRSEIVVLLKKSEIERFLSLFHFSDSPLRGQKIVVDGKEAWIVTPCQCLGDYAFRFFDKDAVIVTVTFHHQEFIRIEGPNGGMEFDLVPESGAEIRKYVEALMKKS